MKRIRKLLAVLLLSFVLGVVLIVMVSSNKSIETVKLSYSSSSTVNNEYSNYVSKDSVNLFSDSSVTNGMSYDSSAELIEEVDNSYSNDSQSTNLMDNKLLKKTYRYSVESTNYDEFITKIESKVSSFGGYIESEDEVRRTETNSGHTKSHTVRRVSYQIRVPSDRMVELLNILDGEAYVISQNEYVEDVTTQYLDLEAHISSLKDEYSTLNELLSSAESVTEIIEVQDRLTSINYEIESYEKCLDSLKEDIDYSKLYLTVDEVIYYQDTVRRFNSDIAESWYYVFDGWITEVLPIIVLITVSLIPMFFIIGLAVYIISKVVIRNRSKYQQTIVIKEFDDKERN